MRLGDLDELYFIEKLLALGAESPDAKVLMEPVLFDIQQMPTIDAVPVRYGKWTLNIDGSGTCNICHFTQKNVWDMDSWQNFCGVCGADMRDGKGSD